MNKPKEIFLTVFTFPRYTLWKRTGQDKHSYIGTWTIYLLYLPLLALFIFTGTFLYFEVAILYVILSLIAHGKFIEFIYRGDKL